VDQVHSQVFKVLGGKKILGGKYFSFSYILYLKQFFLGTRKFGGAKKTKQFGRDCLRIPAVATGLVWILWELLTKYHL